MLGLWESLWVTCHWLSSDPLGELCLLLQVYCKRFVSQALPFVLCVLGAQVADWAIWGTSPSFIVAPPDVSRPWSALEPWILTSWNGEEPVSLKLLSFSMPEMEPLEKSHFWKIHYLASTLPLMNRSRVGEWERALEALSDPMWTGIFLQCLEVGWS